MRFRDIYLKRPIPNHGSINTHYSSNPLLYLASGMRILLVEDDRGLSASLCQYLTRELFVLTPAYSFAEAAIINPLHFDLVILDWNLGDGQGIDLLKLWKQNKISTASIN